MNRDDFLTLIGANTEAADFIPVACLLKDGHGCAGYYTTPLNEGLSETLVLVNARIVDLRDTPTGDDEATIKDFNEFLEEIVVHHYRTSDNAGVATRDVYGRSIPLSAIPFEHIAVLYPVGRIGELMRRAAREGSSIPTFLDFQNKSILLKILRTKLW